ncbi:MAG: hypothetical protein JO249_13575 [Acidobacteria bacterium]|nr:hypothetical protein [Acidobacteriota bacterium]MBV9481766.1 hypothetical protein [Acidobacteriota bacterium]
MPVHHTLEEYLNSYIAAAGIKGELKSRYSGYLTGRRRSSLSGSLIAKTPSMVQRPARSFHPAETLARAAGLVIGNKGFGNPVRPDRYVLGAVHSLQELNASIAAI